MLSSFRIDFCLGNTYGRNMLTPKDLKNIGALMDGKLEKQKKEITSELTNKLTSKLTGELTSKFIVIIDERLEKQTEIFNQKLDEMKEYILKGVADFMADNLMPVLDKHDTRLERLERHTSHPPGTPVSS